MILIVLILLATSAIVFLPKLTRTMSLLPVEVSSPDNAKRVKFYVSIASTTPERSKGLMFVREMPKNEGMLFIFPDEAPRAFWMKDTFISLDMIFLDKDFKVVAIQTDTKPFDEHSYKSNKSAMYVIEVNAGITKEFGIGEGWTARPEGPIPRGLP